MKKSSNNPTRPETGASTASAKRGGDELVRQAAEAQALAAAMPHNASKASEFGRKNALAPPTGQTVEPASALATASTLSEANHSAKTGDGEDHSNADDAGSLDGARVASAGRALTTNQGVAIGDNQNSLKGLGRPGCGS